MNHRYRVHGVTLESDWPFTAPLRPSTATPDLRLTVSERAPSGTDTRPAPVYVTGGGDPRESYTASLYRLPDWDLVAWSGLVELFFADDRVHCRPTGLDDPEQIEQLLLGFGIGFWLERRGSLAMHASAVARGERGIAFLGENGAGKSTLAAALLEDGFDLLTDNLLAVNVEARRSLVYPGPPQLRFWPEQATRLFPTGSVLPDPASGEEKARVPLEDPRRWAMTALDDGVVLRRIYLPERRPAGHPERSIRITPVGPMEALIELVRHSFAARAVEAAGLQPRRMARLTALLRSVPVRRIVYPSGLDNLPDVRDAILADLDDAAETAHLSSLAVPLS